jgi:hypothetical protein
MMEIANCRPMMSKPIGSDAQPKKRKTTQAGGIPSKGLLSGDGTGAAVLVPV